MTSGATRAGNRTKARSARPIWFCLSETGQVVAEIEDLKVQQVSVAALRQMSGSGAERLIYELNWQSFRLPASDTQNKKWLIVGSGDGKGTRLAKSLVEKGHEVIELDLVSNASLNQSDESRFTMCGNQRGNWNELFDQLSTPQAHYRPEGIAWIFGSSNDESEAIDTSTQTNCDRPAQPDRHTFEIVANVESNVGYSLITTDAIKVNDETALDCRQTQYWGLGRVIGAEQPEFRCRLIDLASVEIDQPETIAAVVDILLTETRDNQLAVRGGQFFVPRMKQAKSKPKTDRPLDLNPAGSYLITGGLGMLGRQAAKWLAENGARQIVLVSRRAPDESTQGFLDTITKTGCEIVIHGADLSSRSDVETMFGRFGTDLKPLAGVIHAAGILDDALIGEQTWERFEKVLAPKVIGASLLHEFTQSLELDFFVFYSSAASVLGSPGQSNYATANAFLDGLAWQRRAAGLPANSINWGPWTEGMADDERLVKRLALQGITPLTIGEAHSAMEKILAADVAQATVMDVDWRRMQNGLGGESPAMLEGLAPAKQKSQMGDSELVGQLKRLRGPAQKELLVKTIQQSLQRILATPEAPEIERPLIEMGLDSLMAVEFGTELQQMLGDQFAVGPTMLFDHPTIDAISDHVLELVASESAETPAAPAVETESPTTESKTRVRDDVAIIGMSCRFPGAHDVDEFWQNLLDGVDSVCEIPADRWDIERYYDADREPGKMYTREGGFLSDIADFDAAFFNISDLEACWIDPQHRMLLENSYRALEDAGIPPHPLTENNVGVFMGIMGQDYAFLPSLDDMDVIKGFQGAGLSHSAGVGRISYVFGFEGPSVAIDTASSSSLVALLQAVRSLQHGDCNLALAGGVNAILAPVNSLLMSKAGLLSPSGRCKSFSAAADGFGRGEGCGVVVLKRLADAQRDGDRIMAVIRGGAVVHNGFSSGITAPNSKSQVRVIREALQDAGIAPAQVQYLEAHGTGTEYGDPMELGAAASVYGKGRQPDQPLLVGSVKANISHLEAAGGVSGLIKTVLALHHGVVPRQAHFDEPSPHIPWQRLPVKMVTEQTNWPETETRIAGITALGLVGTNAHVVLSSKVNSATPDDSTQLGDSNFADRISELMVLSARNEAALRQIAENYCHFIQRNPAATLADICHTAASGRRHFEHRIALTVDSLDDARKKLTGWTNDHDASHHLNGQTVNGETNGKPSNGAPRVGKTSVKLPDGIYQGVSKGTPKIAWVFTGDSQANLDAARELYAGEPTFRELMNEFDQRLAQHLTQTDQPQVRLEDWLNGSDDQAIEPGDLHLFALQAGLAKLWKTWGIEADAVLGFGVGQYVASCVAGGLCFKDALVLVAERQIAIEKLNSVADQAEAAEISQAEADELTKQRLDEFEALADTFNYYPPNLPLICSLKGNEVPVHRSLGGSYWREQVLAATSAEEATTTLGEMNCDFILRIGPESANEDNDTTFSESDSATHLRSLNSDHSATRALLNALGRLYAGGANPDFAAYNQHRDRNRISLPPYPFQKKRYWITEIADYLDQKVEAVKR